MEKMVKIMNSETLIILIFFIAGISEIIQGFPLFLEKVKPNWLYGFRVSKTVNNPEIWYKINKNMGRDFIIAGFILSIGSLIISLLNFSTIEIVAVGLLLIFIPIVIIIIRCFALLKKL